MLTFRNGVCLLKRLKFYQLDMPAMKVLIADDHSIVRSGLKMILEELGEPVEAVEAINFDQAREACERETDLDLVILDLKMPGAGGIDSLSELVEKANPAPVVVFSALESPEKMRSVLSKGVRAFIPKSTDESLIANIFQLVRAGGAYVPPVLGGLTENGGRLAPEASLPLTGTPLEELTSRQLEVLDLLAEGMSNQEISQQLNLNLSTVKTYVTRILKVLGVDNRTRAVLALKEMREEME